MHFVKTAYRSVLVLAGSVVGYYEPHCGGLPNVWTVFLCTNSRQPFCVADGESQSAAEDILVAAVTDNSLELCADQVVEELKSRPKRLSLAEALDVLAGVSPGTYTQENASRFLRLLADRDVVLARVKEVAHG